MQRILSNFVLAYKSKKASIIEKYDLFKPFCITPLLFINNMANSLSISPVHITYFLLLLLLFRYLGKAINAIKTYSEAWYDAFMSRRYFYYIQCMSFFKYKYFTSFYTSWFVMSVCIYKAMADARLVFLEPCAVAGALCYRFQHFGLRFSCRAVHPYRFFSK